MLLGGVGERGELYELLGELDTGGMATVYVAHHRRAAGEPASIVAVKSIRPEIAHDTEFVAMFLDEATLTAKIRHPNVVRTLDLVAAEGRMLIVMEYVAGLSLAKLLTLARQRQRPLPAAIAAAIVTGALRGLHAAHELVDQNGRPLSVVHRDVSPQNILVGVDGVARILDFGVAKAASQRHVTVLGEIKGKVAYMPPEQQQAEAVDRRCDVFAAGVVLWEVLTGKRLFTGADDEAVVRAIYRGSVEPPSRLAPRPIPAQIDAVVLRALALSPAHRWATAEHMAREIAAALPIAAPGEVAAYVQSLGHEELGERSHRIRDLEEQHAAHTTVLGAEEQLIISVLTTHQETAPAAIGSKEGARQARRARRRRRSLLAFAALGLVIALLMMAALLLGMRSSPSPRRSTHTTGLAPTVPANVTDKRVESRRSRRPRTVIGSAVCGS